MGVPFLKILPGSCPRSFRRKEGNSIHCHNGGSANMIKVNHMTMKTISVRKRILGGLWAAVVGDALGVPVEFRKGGYVH
jgi:hypothetical protein